MNNVYVIEKSGRRHKGTLVSCEVCGTEFPSRIDQVRRFCSVKCRSLGQRDRIILTCAYCSKEFERSPNKKTKSKWGKFFCCREHKDLGQRIENGIKEIHPPHYGNGYTEYRKRALWEHGNKCAGCGYNQLEGMLDVHHIDTNRKNGTLSNLIVLCVFCHALITRGYAEVGPDRQVRRKPGL